ncbi:MAG TPA: F0F1 ATP synthase subunit A [Fibrobacteria bacterium]|nr:F0F1 ATP synthase subunit A [Fibrobacteria bacterium]
MNAKLPRPASLFAALAALALPTAAAEQKAGEENLGDFLTHHISNSHEWHPFPGVHIHLPSGWMIGGIDMGISQHVLMMFLAAGLLLLVFSIASRRKPNGTPTNKLGHAMEAMVIYMRDEVIKPNLGEKETNRWSPFFLTLFFFFLFLNLISLIPGFTAATGNVNFTGAMALMIFVVYNVAGMAYNGPLHYIGNIVPKGVPFYVWPIIAVIEFMGLFTKAVALCIRLFANMTAGHILILSLTGLIIVFKTAWVALGFLPMTLFIYLIEVLVAFLQAYVFTLLSALFVGMAIHQEH